MEREEKKGEEERERGRDGRHTPQYFRLSFYNMMMGMGLNEL